MTRVLFFGRLRDVAGCSELACDLPATVTTIAALRQWLAEHDPVLGEAIQAPGVRVALNQTFCISDAAPTLGAREIAFMSPLSGG
jgi:molybdopterin synthase sulfur carrier subunit